MVIDTSAVVAIALNEPDAAELELQIVDDPVRLCRDRAQSHDRA